MKLPRPNRLLRAVGFDDAPFVRRRGAAVQVAGVVCAGTRFEGLVWGAVRRDGWNATDTLAAMLEGSKFLPQIHLVLLDGIALGGLNVVNLPGLAARLKRPCVAVMRRLPDLEAMAVAICKLPHAERRLDLVRRAGTIYERPPFVFQVHGLDPGEAAEALARLTDTGHVPEALRLAHLIGAAVVNGESGKRA